MFIRSLSVFLLLLILTIPAFGKEYTITEEELMEFEQISNDFEKYKKQAGKALGELLAQLSEARSQLDELGRLLMESEKRTTVLEASFQAYETENEKIIQTLRRNRWIERVVWIGISGISIYFAVK